MIIYSKLKNREKQNKLEIIILSFIAINILWYLKTPGWYRYFFTAHVLAFIFFPAALTILFTKIKVLRCPYIDPRALTLLIVFLLFIIQANILISKRTDSLYYSNDAATVAKALNNSMKINEDVLVINAPSIAFLLNTRNIYQYLQINPKLAFGKHSLKNENNKPHKFIVAHSLDGIDIPNIREITNSKYTQIEFGSYTLYTLKK